MQTSLDELTKDVSGLVTLPDVFVRINRLLEDPDSNISDLAKTVSQDPSFTVRLLRIANSAFYGLSSTVDTVNKAVSIIGTGQIRNLALATSVAHSFAGLPNTLVSMEHFWRHSLYCALLARLLAQRTGGCDADAVFTAALLHDIGELVIFNRLPEQAKEALLMVLDSADELPVHIAEQQVMGFDHSHVGAKLAQQWQLPPMLCECIAHHHDVGAARHFPREVALVHIANILALMAEVHTTDLADVPAIDPHAWTVSGLTAETVVPATLEEVQQEIDDVEHLFFGG